MPQDETQLIDMPSAARRVTIYIADYRGDSLTLIRNQWMPSPFSIVPPDPVW
jgi:hypothetical protein